MLNSHNWIIVLNTMFSQILCDLLSPENVSESLKESALNSSHDRNKAFMQGSETEVACDHLQLDSELVSNEHFVTNFTVANRFVTAFLKKN